MQLNMSRALLTVVCVVSVAACGGGGGGTDVITCAQDPTQAKCPPVGPTPTLRSAATAKGRSFGTAVDGLFLTAGSASYDTIVAREFSMLTAGNVMKWSSIHRDSRASYRYARPDSFVAFAVANNMKVRGHTLVWYQQNPTWLTSTTWNAETLKVVLQEHIANVVGHYKGKLYGWDVVNEALNDGNGTRRSTIWQDNLGDSYIDIAFQAARAADPAALLFYNDYSIETPGAKQDAAFALVSGMKTRGIPIDGIGFQAHFLINADGSGAPSRSTLTTTFQRFAALGLKVNITELDIRVPSGAAGVALAGQAAALYSDVTAACLAVPACDVMVVWGVSDDESWIPSTFAGYSGVLLFQGTGAGITKKATYTSVMGALGG